MSADRRGAAPDPTPDHRALAAVLAAVPALSRSTILHASRVAAVMSPMHRAVASACWMVDVDPGPGPLFVKILDDDLVPFVDIAASGDAATKVAALGLTPRPLHVLVAQRAIVFERLGPAWRTARMDDLRRPSVMKNALAAQRAIQAGPRFRLDWTVFDGLRLVLDKVDEAGIELGEGSRRLREAAAAIERALLAAGLDSKPCHADGLASNIMIGPDDAVRLVDFDRACNTDPIYDLAVLFNEAFVSEDEMRAALDAVDGGCRQTVLNRCRLYAMLDDLLWGAWGCLLNTTSRRRGVEFLKYAQWRLLRCRLAMDDIRFGAMLAQL